MISKSESNISQIDKVLPDLALLPFSIKLHERLSKFPGENHRKKVETLATYGKAQLVSIVDCDSTRMTNLNVSTYHSVENE
jgi:hypothetical protein